MSAAAETGTMRDERYRDERAGERERYYDDDRYRSRDGASNRDGGSRGQRGIFISTESRHGLITTEFWMTVLAVAALVVLAFAVDEIGDRFGIGAATVVVVAYVVSRGIAKAGSESMKQRKVDDGY